MQPSCVVFIRSVSTLGVEATELLLKQEVAKLSTQLFRCDY